MKRVLCIIDSLGAGGAQRQMVGLATFLKEREYEVSVAFFLDKMFYSKKLSDSGVSYVLLREVKNKVSRTIRIISHIREVKPDVIISYLDSPNICSCLAKIVMPSIHLIVSERNTSQKTGLGERIRFNLFRLANYVVPNSYAQGDYLSRHFPFLNKKVVVIPNFVDLNHFVPPMEKKKNNLPEIVVVATIWQSKNTIGFVDAVKQLKDKGYQFHVSWYGKDESTIEYFNQCQNKIDAYHLNDYIELKNKTSNIKEKYQDGDYFCLPSFYEGTPNVICEAMACGLPVACSDVCDNARYVHEGENGFLFNPKETSSIVMALEKMLKLSDVEYKTMCVNSRKRAIKDLSKERFIDSYLTLIND